LPTDPPTNPPTDPPTDPPEDPSPEPEPTPTPEDEEDKPPGLPLPLPLVPLPGRAEPKTPLPAGSPCKGGSCGKQISDQVGGNTQRLDKLNALLNGLDLAAVASLNAKLDIINAKLGPQLPNGGIGNFLKKLGKWLQVDRVLNVLTFAATVHNAVQLSNDIGQTLASALSNVLKLIGIKDAEGNTLNVSEIIGKSIEALIKGIIGEENYKTFSTNWAKANRIYQSTNNVLNAFQGLSSAILTGLEMTAGKVGKIGNALRNAGEVLENAYGWMNPAPKFNRVIQTLESLQNGASTIQQVTQAPLDIIDATTELTNATTELTKAIKEDDKPENKGKESPEPENLKTEKTKAKTDSKGLDLFDFDFDFDFD
jgi:hypothetical protein